MDKKRKTKNAKDDNGQSANSIGVGGDVSGSNVAMGNNNTINQNTIYQTIPPEKIALQKLRQLPPAPADFTGREEQLTQVLDALAKHNGAAEAGGWMLSSVITTV